MFGYLSKSCYLSEFIQTNKMSKNYSPLLIFIVTTLAFTLLVSAEDAKKDKKIVIVGAGAAGIATAKTLLQNGYESVQILEAQDYYGGRIRTVFDEEHHRLELGAQRCVL